MNAAGGTAPAGKKKSLTKPPGTKKGKQTPSRQGRFSIDDEAAYLNAPAQVPAQVHGGATEIPEPDGQNKVHDPEWDQEDIDLLNKIKQARMAFPVQPPV